MTITHDDQPRTSRNANGHVVAGTEEAQRLAAGMVEARRIKALMVAEATELPTDALVERGVRTLVLDLLRGKVPVRHAADSAAVLRVLLDAMTRDADDRKHKSAEDVLDQLRDLIPHYAAQRKQAGVESVSSTLTLDVNDRVPEAEPASPLEPGT